MIKRKPKMRTYYWFRYTPRTVEKMSILIPYYPMQHKEVYYGDNVFHYFLLATTNDLSKMSITMIGRMWCMK